MKGIIFSGMPGAATFPSMAYGSGNLEFEDTYRYVKRNIDGEMRRFDRLGYVVKIQCKWGVLTSAQFNSIQNYVSQGFFNVSVYWKGQYVTKEFYAGNISATPYRLDSSGRPKYYTDVSFNIISKEVWE